MIRSAPQMDIGVGSFVFSQGVVSAIPLLKEPNYLLSPLTEKTVSVLKKVSPVIALGFIRLLSVKGTDYPVRFESCFTRTPNESLHPIGRNMYQNTENTGTFSSHWRYCPLCKRSCILISRIFQYLYSVS